VNILAGSVSVSRQLILLVNFEFTTSKPWITQLVKDLVLRIVGLSFTAGGVLFLVWAFSNLLAFQCLECPIQWHCSVRYYYYCCVGCSRRDEVKDENNQSCPHHLPPMEEPSWSLKLTLHPYHYGHVKLCNTEQTKYNLLDSSKVKASVHQWISMRWKCINSHNSNNTLHSCF